MLTIRMVVATIVGLYTSRVVFAQLGEVDYGIYGVVGGILGIIGFLNASMAGASSRFITYAIGVGDESKINEIFNASFFIHCGIAILVIVIGETFGVWFLNNVLNIPPERLHAAWWVLQFSIISTAFSITQIPYTSVIMAYERMNIYAYMELANVTIKLIIVYLLSISIFDKLIFYAFLLLAVSVGMALCYRVYCIRNFDICKLTRIKDYSNVKTMLKFSIMDLYGNVCATVNNQGIVYAINIFFGVIYNAAASLANTINGTIMGLTQTIAIAFKPQIIKQYSQGNIREMETVMNNSVKFTLIAMSMLAVPCFVEASYVLWLWLGKVPAYSTEFLRIILVLSFLPTINNACNSAIHATGNIKALTYINGSMFLLMPVCMFIAFKLGAGVLWGYGIEIIGMAIICTSAISIVKNLIPEFNHKRLIQTIFKVAAVIVFSTLPVIYIHKAMDAGFVRLFAVGAGYVFVAAITSWAIILNKDNRRFIISKISNIIPGSQKNEK